MVAAIPWYVRRPSLLAVELNELARTYPEFRVRPDAETVMLEGEITVRGQGGTRQQQLVLIYPEDYDYRPPIVVPLREPQTGSERPIQWFAFRHQMADGALCLFQRDTSYERVTGVDALRRAERWLHEHETGTLSPELDTIGAELEEHYTRDGILVAGPLLDRITAARGRIAALQVEDAGPLKYVLTHAENGTDLLADEAALQYFVGNWWKAAEDYWKLDLPQIEERAKKEPHRYWVGEYVTVSSEPPIMRDVEAVARFLYPHEAQPLRAFETTYARPLLADAGLIIGIRYPARQATTFDWLFLRLRLREKALERVEVPGVGVGVVLGTPAPSAEIEQRTEVHALTLEDFRRSNLQLRNSGRVPVNTEDLKVTVAGVGALGSTVGDLLAKSGLGEVALFDPQSLRAGNALRHLGGLLQIGEQKVRVVAANMVAHNPYCAVSGAAGSVLTYPEPFASGTAIVSTIANDSTELALNERAIDSGTTIYYLRAFRAGEVGCLIRVRPHIDACFECLRHHYADGFADLVVPPQAEETIKHECGEPILAASAADLTAVAAIGVRRVLNDLAAPGDVNHWLWTTAGVEDVPALRESMSEVRRTLPPHPACRSCAPPPIRRIIVEAPVRERIVELSRKKFPSETGGILVGAVRGDVLTITAASDAGPTATESASGFTRDGAHAQAFLTAEMSASQGATTYVGEWHSHPKHPSQPSHTDVTSLASISADDAFKAPCPAMLIIALAAADAEPEVHGSVYPESRQGFVVDVE
ncbi:MAG TPA: Mov34/MPN/PAD-1 family protein [Thermoanaerobaculia bacterium]|jgi:integrative and conjugative element protein (TIGR02256 family)